MAQIDKISVFLFVLSILPFIYAGNSSTVLVTRSSLIMASSSVHSSSTISLSSSPIPTHTPSAHFSITVHNSTINPSTATVTNYTASIRPTATVSSRVYPTASISPSTGQPPTTSRPIKDCHTCEKMLAKERRYKWAAVSFDLIFAVALVVMTIMYLRLRRLYREMEGDGSLSRLI